LKGLGNIGTYINPQIGYYEGDPISPADTEVAQRPSGSLTVPGVTVSAPAGATINLPDQSLPVTYTWDGSAWVVDLPALRTARLALIRAHRNALYDYCNVATAKGNNKRNRGLERQAGEWNTKLDDVPQVAIPALDALTTAAEIASYAPDYTPPAYVYVVSAVQFFTVTRPRRMFMWFLPCSFSPYCKRTVTSPPSKPLTVRSFLQRWQPLLIHSRLRMMDLHGVNGLISPRLRKMKLLFR